MQSICTADDSRGESASARRPRVFPEAVPDASSHLDRCQYAGSSLIPTWRPLQIIEISRRELGEREGWDHHIARSFVRTAKQLVNLILC